MKVIREMIKFINFHKKKNANNKEIVKSDYYNLSETCQIPNLSKIFEQYFGKISDGVFIEFGEFDGDYVSNSSGLADIGWTGYYIEPIPQYYEKCKLRHINNKNVSVSNYAIGEKNGEIKINIAGPLSTASTFQLNDFKQIDWASSHFHDIDTIVAPMITLEEYLVKENINPNFELLIIDVEGYEWNALKNFRIDKWNPQMVIIELHDQNDDYLSLREECNKVVEYFYKNNYKIIYKDYSNTIYVPMDKFPIANKSESSSQ